MPERFAFRAIANFTYDWETWMGPEGTARWVNPAVQRITGYSPDECLQMANYPIPLVHSEDRERIGEALSGAALGTSGNDLEFRLVHRDGILRWGAMSWQSLVDPEGKRLGYRTSVRDITERKRVEERMLEALNRAREAERTRSTFLANISHELRTPVHNLLGYTDLLASSHLSDEQKKWVTVLRQEGEALLSLVGDLLSMTGFEHRDSRIRTEQFDLKEIVSSVVAAHRPRFDARNLSLYLDLPKADLQVQGDREATGRVLRNFLDNAIKYTDSGSVHVRLRFEDPIVLEVEDTGVGMDPEHIPELRRPFIQGNSSRNRTADGVGLGLAICDRIAHALGGRIEIHSTPGKGSKFSLFLPRVPVQKSDAPKTDDGPLPKRVLVVDDRQSSRELAQAFLRKLKCESDSADSAKSARELFRSRLHDVVLMDLHMPEIDGVSAAQIIRAEAQDLGHMPRILAMTADVFAEEDFATVSAFDGFITKPVSLNSLEQSLRQKTGQPEAWPNPSREQVTDTEPAAYFDPIRLEELRTLRRSDGQSFLAYFGPRVANELDQLADELLSLRHHPSSSTALTSLSRLIHNIAGSANSVGAFALARYAEEVRSSLSSNPISSSNSEVRVALSKQAQEVAQAIRRELNSETSTDRNNDS